MDCLWSSLTAVASRTPERVAIVSGEHRLTYGQFAERATMLAAGLHDLGLRPGDRVGYLAPNRPEYLELLFAVAQLGAALVPLNTRQGESDLGHALRSSGAKFLFFASGFRKHDYIALIEAVLGGIDGSGSRKPDAAPEIERLVCLDSDAHGLGLLGYDEVLSRGRTAGQPDLSPVDRGASTGLMLFTSGSSGAPKPVMLRQGQLVRNMARVRSRQGVKQDDRVLSFLPYFHVFGGVISTLVPLLCGGRVVMLPAFDADQSLEIAEREKCTVVYGVAPTYTAWLDHPKFASHDLSSIRTGVCSAGLPAMSATAKRVRAALAPMHSLFGMTETTGVASFTQIGDDEALATGSAGVALPDAEIAIFKPGTDRRVEADAEGEIRIRGDMITSGYFRMQDQTARAIDSGGWLHTGDRGYLDRGGYLYVAGRLDDRLRSAGENIDPREVEQFIKRHPAVEQCQVIGVPDPKLLEVPVAFVILKPSASETSEEAIRGFCRGKIADFKIPRRVFFMTEFPGWMHKIQRFKLKEEAIRLMATS
jgi:fatty-acyl-CoA synthase